MELDAVPIDNAAGTCAPGNNQARTGISIKLAPPPQKALNAKASTAQTDNIIPDVIIGQISHVNSILNESDIINFALFYKLGDC